MAPRSTYDATDDTNITSGSYDVRKDVDLDGDHDANDVTQAKSYAGTYQTLGIGVLSSTAVMNRKGYAGAECARRSPGFLTVRARDYMPSLGRWVSRDSIGYVDGNNLYGYAVSAPVLNIDPFGLSYKGPPEDMPYSVPMLPDGGSMPTWRGWYDLFHTILNNNPWGNSRICNNTSHPIIIWNTTDGFMLLMPGDCTSWFTDEGDYWYIPGRGWIKCPGGKWHACRPTDDDPIDGGVQDPHEWTPDRDPRSRASCYNLCTVLYPGGGLDWAACISGCSGHAPQPNKWHWDPLLPYVLPFIPVPGIVIPEWQEMPTPVYRIPSVRLVRGGS